MLSVLDAPARLCDRVDRREWLRVGGLGAFGLSLPTLLAARQARADTPEPEGKACILLFLLGAPPQQETWDPKPGSPVECFGPEAGEYNERLVDGRQARLKADQPGTAFVTIEVTTADGQVLRDQQKVEIKSLPR